MTLIPQALGPIGCKKRIVEFFCRPVFHRWLLALALLLPVPFASASYTGEEKQQLADQATHILGGNANVIARWSDEIRLAVVGGDKPAFQEKAAEIIGQIAQLTDLTHQVIDTGLVTPAGYSDILANGDKYELALCHKGDESTCANLVVVQTSVPVMRRIADAIPLRDVYRKSVQVGKSPYCFFAPFIDAGMTIRQAFVFVREDLEPSMITTCLQEELHQSFGLFNDASGSTWFSFNNRVEPKEITPMDRRLLRCLYSNDFRPGVPAFIVVRKFIASLANADGELCEG